jgi:curli production assembly/transport component CsgG
MPKAEPAVHNFFTPFSSIREFALRCALVAGAGLALGGCSTEAATDKLSSGILPPVVNPVTEVNQSLRDLPPPSNQVPVAVYDYADQTGQFKPSEHTQTLSRAVTQGATSILIKALQDVGDGSWFKVVEREKIDNLLKERSIITQMRMTYLGEKGINPKVLPPLVYAAIIFEGGIIGFDSNIETGGVGARLLGIGGDMKYRLDTITIYLRAVSTKTGEVLASVTTHKSIASVAVQGGVFKFVALDKILEAEAGITKNEPDQLAVQQAIEKAVSTIIVEGAEQGIWSFSDKAAQNDLIGAHKMGVKPDLRRHASTSATQDSASGSGGKQHAQTAALETAEKISIALPEKAPRPYPGPRAVASAGGAGPGAWPPFVMERRATATAVGLTVYERYAHRTTSK